MPLSEFTHDVLLMLVMLVLFEVFLLKSNLGIYLPLMPLAEIAANALLSFFTASSHFDTSRKYFYWLNWVFFTSKALLLWV